MYERIIRRPPVLKDNPKIIGKREKKGPEERVITNPEDIVEKARLESHKILDEAERLKKETLEQIERDKAKALEEIKRLKGDAQKKGYEVGYKEGYEKGLEEGQRKFDNVLSDLLKVITEIQNKRESMLSSVKDEILHIIDAIVRKIVKRDIEKDRDFIRRNVEEAIKLVGNKKKVTVRLSPTDFDIVDKDHIYAMLSSVDQVEIRYDPTLARGDCIVETSFGTIDARVDSQIEALIETLEEGE